MYRIGWVLEDSIKWDHANASDLKRKGVCKRKCAGVSKRKRGNTDESRASSRPPTKPSTRESFNNESGGEGGYVDVDLGPAPASLHQQNLSQHARVSVGSDRAKDKEGG